MIDGVLEDLEGEGDEIKMVKECYLDVLIDWV